MPTDVTASQLSEILAGRSRVVAITGAGISSGSGINTYVEAPRSCAAGGWMQLLIERPWDAVELLAQWRRTLPHAEPNPAHRALAEMESEGRLTVTVTQNVDGLHSMAGSRALIELHGNLRRHACTTCSQTRDLSPYELDAYFDNLIDRLQTGCVTSGAQLLEVCACGGRIRPQIVDFGEQPRGWSEAEAACANADAVLVIGTSGLVQPAATLPGIAAANGAVCIEVNPSPSFLSSQMDFVVRERAEDVLGQLVAEVRV